MEQIKQIGMFLIVIQIVLHMLPNEKYEKYVKVISGSVALLLLLSALSQNRILSFRDVEAFFAKMDDLIEQGNTEDDTFHGLEKNVQGNLETNIAQKIEQPLREEGYCLKGVSVELTENPEKRMIDLDRITVFLSKETDDCQSFYDEKLIKIERIGTNKINIPSEVRPQKQEENHHEYEAIRELLSSILWIDVEKVEVILNGES